MNSLNKTSDAPSSAGSEKNPDVEVCGRHLLERKKFPVVHPEEYMADTTKRYCIPKGVWVQSYKESREEKPSMPWELNDETKESKEKVIKNAGSKQAGNLHSERDNEKEKEKEDGSGKKHKMEHKIYRTYRTAQESILSLLYLIAGSAICGLVVNGILVPKQFVSGGFLGLSLLIYYILPTGVAEYITPSIIYFLFNIPIFLIGYKFVGRRFFYWSLLGTVLFIFGTRFVSIGPFKIDDKILAALFAGVLMGFGNGLLLKSMGSAGGMDILAVAIFKKYSIRLGSTMLSFNAIILLLASLKFGLQEALYTMVYMFVSSQMINIVVAGIVSQRKAVFIISKHWREINRHIMDNVHRGVTLFEARGGYTGEQTDVIYTILTISELNDLKKDVHKIDPHALIIATDTMDVVGFRGEKYKNTKTED